MGYDEESARAAVALAKPTTSEPPAEPLRLASGLPLLVLLDTERRKGGGEGHAQLAIVEETGREATCALGGGPFEVSYDSFSQAALPWHSPHAGWDAELLWDDVEVLRGVSARLQELFSKREALRGRSKQDVGLGANRECADFLPTLAHALDAVTVVNVRDLQSRISLAIGTDAALEAFDTTAQHLTVVGVESLVLSALRASGQAGKRRYGAGQWLTVMVDAGQWVDAQVVDGTHQEPSDGAGSHQHSLLWERDGKQEQASLALHPWNHAPRQLRLAAFEDARRWYSQLMRGQHASIVDALSGRRLDVLEQLVPIDVTSMPGAHSQQQPPLGALRDVGDLSSALHEAHGSLSRGVERKACVLLTAGPAAGKSSMMSQLVVKALAREGGGALVPILVRVQQLQKRLLEEEDAFAAAWNWIDAFLRLKHGETSALYRMLRQAMMARRALLLIDGIDEGGKARERIERHITEVLAPQGHMLLVTSRPAGIDEARYAQFHRLSLAGLSDAQQQQALEQRLGVERAATLLPYLREHMPIDADKGDQRVTSNPLMLSMVASIFELRHGDLGAMPRTVAELYDVATKAMLDRATPVLAEGRSIDDLTPLVIEICFQAHLTEDRVISDTHLKAAAHQVQAGPRALPTFRERILQDKLPLFTLLQAEPLQIQAAHLSFQEYLVARALCQGTRRMLTPAWQLSAFWGNTLKLGGEMGPTFGKGLLYASKANGEVLDLGPRGGKLGGDRPTSLRAVSHIAQVVRSMDISGAKLSVQEAAMIADAVVTSASLREVRRRKSNALAASQSVPSVSGLTATPPVPETQINLDGQSLPVRKLKGTDAKMDLSRKKLRDLSAIVIAALLRDNGSLTSLDISSNPIGENGMRAMGTTLLESSMGVLGALKCDAFEVRVGETVLDLSRKRLNPAAKALLAGVIKRNATLHTCVLDKFVIGDGHDSSLDLSRKSLDDMDAVIAAEIIGNGAMARLQVTWRLTVLIPRLETWRTRYPCLTVSFDVPYVPYAVT